MPKFLVSLDKAMDVIERNLIGWATIGMVAIIFVNVVLRNWFSSSLVWGNELSSYLNILAVYIAVGAGFKVGSHVGVSAVVDFVVPSMLKKAFSVLADVIILIFCAFVAYEGIRMTVKQFSTNQTSPVLDFPMWIIYAIIVLGMFFSALRVIMNIAKKLHRDDNTPNVGETTGGAKLC